jgi:hypothetical protein
MPPTLRLVWDLDAEVERIMTMPASELLAEVITEGYDPHAIAEQERARFREILELVKHFNP